MSHPLMNGLSHQTNHNLFKHNLVSSQTNNFPSAYFVQELNGLLFATEGDPIQLETCVEPAGDNSLRVDWYKDGQLLSAGSRFNTLLDRGYVSLEILYTFPEDSGSYFCVVSNASGEMQSNEVFVNIIPEVEVHTDSRLAQEEALAKLHSQTTESFQREDRHQPKNPPQFIRMMPDQLGVKEGEQLHLEVRLTPTHDATMRIEWFKDGNPISTGSRFNIIYDRGVCLLDIGYCIAEDAGQYQCVAINALGQSSSNILHFSVASSERVVTTSSLPAASIASIRQLEEFGDELASYQEPEKPAVPPSILSMLEPPSLQVMEGDPIFIAARVDTGTGDKISIIWLKDGEVLQTGSRVSGQFELGVASLIIRHTYGEDSGEYWCLIISEFGQAETNHIVLQCQADASIHNAPLTKGISAIQQLEEDLNKLPAILPDDDECTDSPIIVKQLEDLPELDEGQPVHLDLRVEPAHDNNLSVEWYKDNAQLSTGSRFHFIFERGYASLDILYTIAEDSGQYCCVVSNKNGTVQSNHVVVQCIRGAGVVTDSNLAEGSAGYQRIKEMDDDGYRAEDANDFRYREEEEEVNSPPVFQILPGPMYSYEGGPAKFLVRTGGFPRPEVSWFINDEPIVEDTNHHVYNDGAINCLEIHRCQILGESNIRVLARNHLGEKEANAALNVVPMEDFRPGLKHIRPENPYKKMMSLKKVDVSPELDNKLKKAKPSAEAIQMIERESHFRLHSYKSNDVLQTEQLYDQVAAGLKKYDPHAHGHSNKQDHQQ